MLDDDLYKINMGSVVFHLFPRAIVTYEFFNRGKTQFPDGFVDALRRQIEFMAALELTYDEEKWLKKIPYVRPTYVEWLRGYHMDPSEVAITQTGGELSIKIKGPWYRTIYWEVKLMAVISELYFRMNGQLPAPGWIEKIEGKGMRLQTASAYWIDFGTRRRFSLMVQDRLVQIMSFYRGFLGTSNPYLAYKYNVVPHGTYAHESIMAMSALYGVRMANKMWMKHWSEHYEGNVGVALTDTFTTDAFLQDFGSYEARLFDGVRQDSKDPIEWGCKMLEHYKKLNISPISKRFVFSDNLNVDKYLDIHRKFSHVAQPVAGIGTHFSNDVGVKPLNMVIKMTGADFGHGMIDVVKLSDEPGKHTGKPEAIDLAKRQLGIV
jgi:nicotinate phosphoribosyltransferase